MDYVLGFLFVSWCLLACVWFLAGVLVPGTYAFVRRYAGAVLWGWVLLAVLWLVCLLV